MREGMGYLYPLTQKLAVGRAIPGNSGICPDSPDIGVRRLRTSVFCGPVTVTRRLRIYVRILRTLGPDIPD
jgi:hypothetical protein